MNAPPDSASRQGRARPALRLIKTQDLRLEQWLDVRGTGIGSSDAAAAVGLNTYCSALELFPINSGQDADLDKVDPNDDSSPMFWGSILEDIEAASYTSGPAIRFGASTPCSNIHSIPGCWRTSIVK